MSFGSFEWGRMGQNGAECGRIGNQINGNKNTK